MSDEEASGEDNGCVTYVVLLIIFPMVAIGFVALILTVGVVMLAGLAIYGTALGLYRGARALAVTLAEAHRAVH